MNKDTAVRRAAEAGYEVRHQAAMRGDWWSILQKNERDGYDALAEMTFKNEKLEWVSRRLHYGGDPGSIKLVRNFYFAARDLEVEGNNVCLLTTKNQETAEFAGKSTSIRCGRRTLLLAVSRIKDQTEAVNLDQSVK